MREKATLEEMKALVSQKYLGKAGVHAVGMRRSQDALTLYVDQGLQPGLRKVLKLIEQEISPFKLVVIEEGEASLTSGEHVD